MRFYEFINKLYNSSNEKSQERYVLNIISALCGESNPFSANKDAPFSIALPEGLRGDDSSYRKKLYSDKSKGLSGIAKQHIRECADKKYTDDEITNKDTFITYLEESIPSESFSGLCTSFEVFDNVDRFIMFEGIYEQFIKFARSTTDETDLIVPEIVSRLLDGKTKTTEPTSFSSNLDLAKGEVESDNENKKMSQMRAPSEKIREIFKKSYSEYHIAEFVGDWFWGINSDLLRKVEHFIKNIEDNILYEYDNDQTHDQTKRIYKAIKLFIKVLREYKDNIEKYTNRYERDVVRAIPKYIDDLDESIKFNRQRLQKLVDKIYFDVKIG